MVAIGCSQDTSVEIKHMQCADTLSTTDKLTPIIKNDSWNIACPEDCSDPK